MEVHTGFIGITLATTPPRVVNSLTFIQPSDRLRAAELRLQDFAQGIFKALCDTFAKKGPKEEKTAALISLDDLSELPPNYLRIVNAIHSIVKKKSVFSFASEADNIYCIPKSQLQSLSDFTRDFADKCPEYMQQFLSAQDTALMEPKYQAYLEMGDVQAFAAILNASFRDRKMMRAVALEKIAIFKMMAFKENEKHSMPEIDPQEVPWVRQKLFEMFKFCDDYEVKKRSLIELNDLIETDSLTSENLGSIVILYRDMETYLNDNLEKIQGKLIPIVIETYAKILSLILLYSPKSGKNTIVLDENAKLATKTKLDDLTKLNISGDVEAEYWRLYASNCLDLLNTTKTENEKWLEIAGAFALSTIQIAATIKFSPSQLIDVLDQSYKRIKTALQNDLPTMPYWLPPVVMINRFCQSMMHSFVDFKKITPTLRKFKHSIQEVSYGIIVTLERIALKTRVVSVEIEAMKLLLQYINIHNKTLAYRLVMALGRILNYRQKPQLSNTVYLLMTLIDETLVPIEQDCIHKLRHKLLKFREANPTIDKRPNTSFHPYLIKYFLRVHGFIDDFGGRPPSFVAASALHSNNIKFKANQGALLKRIDQIVKITDVDVHGNTLYHASVWYNNPEMIIALKESELNIEIKAQDYQEGNTALHLAIKLEYQEVIEALLQVGPAEMILIKNKEGNTPLHLAALSKPALLSLLLEKATNPSPVNKNGQTPLALAIEKDLKENAILLMTEKLKRGMLLEATAALSYAIKMQEQKEAYETLQGLLLLIKKIDYNIALKILMMMADEKELQKCGPDFAYFHAFNLKNNPEYAESFAPFTAYPQPRSLNRVALQKGSALPGAWPPLRPPPIIEQMKKLNLKEVNGFNFDRSTLSTQDEFGNTPLFYAAFYPAMTHLIPKIAQCGGEINHLNHVGFSALHIAVIQGNIAGVRELLLQGADINIEGGFLKFTPLHMAAYLLNHDIVKLLLEHSADPNRQSYYGDAALHMACLFRLEKNQRVPDTSLVKKYDATPTSSPLTKSKTLKELREEASYHKLPIDESAANPDHLEKIYQRMLAITSLKNSIIALESDLSKKRELNQILDTMKGDFRPEVEALESYEKRMKLIYILILLFKHSTTEITQKDFFGNNILHLSALYCCPTIPKIICFYHQDLYWKENYDQLLPIECAQNDHERVRALFNAMSINYVNSDWNGQQDEEKNGYMLRMATAFDIQTSQRLPLRHIFAKANLDTLFEWLARLEGERAAMPDRSNFKQTSLHLAARYGHSQILKICAAIEKEKKISFLNQRDHFHNTAGHIAIIYRQPIAIEFAQLGKEAMHAKNDDGRTMLHLAAIRGHLQMVQDLISLGAHSTEPDAHGDMPLHLACIHAHPSLVAFFLKKNPETIEALDEEGRAPLHHAVMMFFKEGHAKLMMGISKADCEDIQRDSLAVIRILRETQPDLDVADSSGVTALMIAAFNGYEESVELLLGNDYNQKRSSDIYAQDSNQQTALHLAAMAKRVKVIELLLEHDRNFCPEGAEHLYAVLDINNETPLLSMVKNLTPKDDGDEKLIKIVDLFIRYGGKLTEEDENGSTLLHWACLNGVTSLARYLLQIDAIKNHLHKKNTDGDTPLHFAAMKGHRATVELLAQHTAHADAQNRKGVTPLMLSVKHGKIDIALYFISLDIILHTLDNHKRNFIHYLLQDKAVLDENEKKLLTSAIQRNPHLIGKRDQPDLNTPLHLAGRNGNADALKIVTDHSHLFNDLLEIMRKKNLHDRDAKQEFEESKKGAVQAGQQTFKDIWQSIKPRSITSSRSKRVNISFFNPSRHHSHHHHRRFRRIIPKGENGFSIAVPPPEKSGWRSCFGFFSRRRVNVVMPDDNSINDD